MRTTKWLIAASVLFMASSCGENSSTETTDNDTMITADVTNPVPATVNDNLYIPDSAKTAFTAKYPNVSNQNWSRYEPVDHIDWEWSGWPSLDTSDYMVRFNQDNSDHWAWYDSDNNWIGTVSNISDFNSLPASVNSTIKSQYDGYTIVSVDKENDKDKTAYEIDLTKGEDKMRVLISENGKVMKKKSVVDGVKTKEKNM